MTKQQARIPLLDPPYAPETQKLFDLVMPDGMPPLDLFRALATSERIFPRFMRAGILDRGPVEPVDLPPATRHLDALQAMATLSDRTLYSYARGDDHRNVHVERIRKSLSTEHTFDQDIDEETAIDEVLESMAAEVSQGLHKREISTCTITIKARYPDFTTVTRSHTLPAPTADPDKISVVARELIRTTDAFTRSVRLLGVGASNLVTGGVEQLALFGIDEGGSG